MGTGASTKKCCCAVAPANNGRGPEAARRTDPPPPVVRAKTAALQAPEAWVASDSVEAPVGPIRRASTSTDFLREPDLTPIEAFANSLLLRWMSVEQVVKEADTDCSGMIEWEEFADLCTQFLRLRLCEAEIRKVFEEVDWDNSGSISVDELKEAIDQARQRIEDKMTASVMEDSMADDDDGPPPNTKLVALVAHNNMKASMMAFVAKHRDFFRRVRIVTTGSTGGALEKKLRLAIARKVASGPLGGDQEIGAMITQNEVGAAFFFIDPLSAHPHEADIRALTRICEVHNCACATNPVTGEALVHAFLTCPRHVYLLNEQGQRRDSDVVKTYKQAQQAVICSVASGK